MINMQEVLETNNMIAHEKLDVRTITMGISLLDCVDSDLAKMNEKIYNKITTYAKDLVSTGDAIGREFGVPIVNKRISVTPIALVGGSACKKSEDFVEIAKTLDKAAKEVGVNFIGGYSALVSKGMTPAEELLIRSIPQALACTDRVCSSINVGSTKTGLNMDAVRLMGEMVVATAEATKDNDSLGCAKLVVFCNAPDDNPFMAGAFHGVTEADAIINVGVSGPGVVKTALEKVRGENFEVLCETIKKTAFKITRVGQLVAREASKRLGVKFGIWIEPEMVSEDSDLYRKHPDWALTVPGRNPVRSRNQLVLDFSRKEVVDEIYDQICKVLDQGNIEYVKWDMNRSLMDVYSSVTRDQGRVLHDYVLGLYDFLERLVQRYPNLLIEGCSGGGGRFDAGMMYYTPQIWCSDNTDAIDRLRIQYGTSFGYPVSVVGSHVSAVPNHQTGRKTPLHTRGVVAMSGTFGYELNLMKLSEEEKQEIREQIAEYKSYAPIIQNGLYYRLSNPTTEEICAWEFVHTDEKEQSKVLLNIVMQVIHGNMTVNYVKLQGLEETAVYREEKSGKRYTGAALMYGGMPLPIEPGEYQAYQYCFVKE